MKLVEPEVVLEHGSHIYTHLETGICLPSISEVLAWAGMVPSYPAGVAAVAAARERGTRIHAALEAELKGEGRVLLEYNEEDAVTAALEIIEARDWQIVATEYRCHSFEPDIAGTADIVVLTPGGRLAVVDLKTGSTVGSHLRWQLRAYAGLIAPLVMDEEVKQEEIEGYILHTPRGRDAVLYEAHDNGEWPWIQKAATLYQENDDAEE